MCWPFLIGGRTQDGGDSETNMGLFRGSRSRVEELLPAALGSGKGGYIDSNCQNSK